MPISIRASLLPYTGGTIATIVIWASYFIARAPAQPHVKPFPITDITHCGMKFPQYIVFRIGLNSVLPLFCICWYLTQNHLKILYFQILGFYNTKLWIIGFLGILSSICLGLSTSTISDGGDMSGLWHGRGAKGFFILAYINCFIIGWEYRKLWKHKPGFVPRLSYLYKTSVQLALAVILLLSTLEDHKYIKKSNLVEWFGTFYVIGYFFSLGYDFDKLNLTFKRK